MKHPGLPSEATAPLERRRPYEPPAIEETSQFETLALACGQTPSGGSSCSGDPYDYNDDNYNLS